MRIGIVLFLLIWCQPSSVSSKIPEEQKLALKLMQLARASGERVKYEHVLSIARASIHLESTCLPGVLDRRDFVAIAWTESRFNPYSIGSSGEIGTWQILEYKTLGRELGVRNAFDVESNGRMACEVLREKYKGYHSYRKTIQAFNGLSPKTGEYKYYRLVQRFKSKV